MIPALLAALLLGTPAAAQHAPYAGLKTRTVSTLSAQDIAEIAGGRGWGLALPAELNGYPGPAHVLEMADLLALAPGQRARAQAIYDAMQAEARRLGADYIAAEKAVDAVFRDGPATPGALTEATARAGVALAALRAVHLVAHLEMAPVLTSDQRHLYRQQRGYAGGQAHGGHTGH